MRIWGRVAVVAGVAGLGVAGVTGAAAEPPGPESPATVVLRWNAPSECPTGDHVLDDARSLAANRGASAPSGPSGTSPSAGALPPPKKPVEVDGVAERLAADRWALTLTIGARERRLEAASCAQLARAGALFLAVVMDPTFDEAALGERAPGAQGEAVPDAGPPVPSAPSAPPTPPAPSGKREVSGLVAATFMIDVGTLPRAEPLGVLELGIRYRRFEVTLQGAAGPSQDKMLDSGVGARMRPQSAMLVPCFAALALDRFRLAPCARGELGWIHVDGIDVSQARATDAVWVSAGGELSAWWLIGANFEARIGAGLLVPVVRPTFEVTGAGTVFEPGMIALRAATAVVMRF
jgi:hypothetical protein